MQRDLVVCFLGVGSNIGHRLTHIRTALAQLDARSDTKVLATSHLYESLPMYYTDQDRFLNAVIKVETSLRPLPLLQAVKSIEAALGRKKTIDNGPRQIDLDLLIFGNETIDDTANDLFIPHLRLDEREFVLRPLADLAPDLLLPRFGATPLQLLSSLKGPSELTRQHAFALPP